MTLSTCSDILYQVVSLFPANVCAGICKRPEWQILSCNPAFVEFFYTHITDKELLHGNSEDLVGESLRTLFYRTGFSAAVDAIQAGGPGVNIDFTINQHSYIFVWTHLSDEGMPTNTTSIPAEGDDGGSPLAFFFFLEVPRASSASECGLLTKELQVIIDSLHDGIWVIDGNGYTVHVNQALKRIAGIDAKDVLGKHVSVPMQEGRFSSCVTLNALEQKRPVTMFDDYECGTRCLNTSTPIFDESGDIWRVVASIRDMTELETLQKRLAEAELEAHIYKGKLATMQQHQPTGFIANSKAMRACARELEKAARAPSGILILGETGTGKTLAASLVHRHSPRKDAPFITVNCAAIPSSLIESELFGYEKGAFTGAGQSGRKGFFELADRGTILLDEIGELPLNMQAKLLHVLDSQSFHKVGGEKSIKVDTRVIAATNRPLEQLVAAGEFRADLYYRLRVLSVQIPPLREHPEDIPELAMSFLDEACKRHGIVKTLSPKVLRCFAAHTWPGNVRELRAAVEFLAAMAEGSIIRVTDLPSHILGGNTEALLAGSMEGDVEDQQAEGLKGAVQALERTMIRAALAETGSTYKAAAKLRISQSTVVRKARQLGITVADEPEPPEQMMQM